MDSISLQSRPRQTLDSIVLREKAIAVAFVPSPWAEGCCIGTPVFLGVMQSVDVDEDGDITGDLIGLVVVGDIDGGVARCFEKGYGGRIQAEGFELLAIR